MSKRNRLPTAAASHNKALTLRGPSHIVVADLPYIAAGGSSQVALDYAPHAVENAQYPNSTFKITANPSHRIIESNYSNNTRLVHVSVQAFFCPSSSSPSTASPTGH